MGQRDKQAAEVAAVEHFATKHRSVIGPEAALETMLGRLKQTDLEDSLRRIAQARIKSFFQS